MWASTGAFQTLMEAAIAEAAARDDVDLSLVSVDSTVARADHHAASMTVDPELLGDLEKALSCGTEIFRATRQRPLQTVWSSLYHTEFARQCHKRLHNAPRFPALLLSPRAFVQVRRIVQRLLLPNLYSLRE
ncbi:hypothetical protein ACWC9Q_36655 [Streptomyces sp. NPDC001142]